MSSFLLSQIVILIAVFTDIISFQCKQRKYIIACLVLSSTFISLHFIVLNIWTAGGLAFVAAVRFAATLLTTSTIVMLVFMVASVGMTLLTYQNYLSIIGCAATLFGTAASFCRNDKLLRELMLICSSLWLVHNILAGSPLAILIEIIFIGSNIVGYFRFFILQGKEFESKKEPGSRGTVENIM